ncbi:TonB-dependent receptor domain-containing protein [uncultured Paludibaculum sp.]|uniref:TonB-dependent receptor n=1 Tax=uncultured Paludibaculum sp. TaxID=1765020 RepID=UPI002AAAB2CE|nr:TonB-dependent receptor [uncultured Paludibaculum sp.]
MLQKLRMLLAAAVFAAIPMYAQEVRASLAGVVSDPVGAPIPGVTVVLTSVERNVSTTTETNEQGSYLFPFVVSGKYTLTVERTGFKKYVRQNIVLEAQDKARADVALVVGDMTQSVNVAADVSQLQTETASRSQIISNQLIANLPTQGRNPFQIAWAMPGVVKAGDWRYLRAFDTGGMSGFSINGGKKGDNEVLIDGISNVRGNRNVVGVPSMEAVQEFKVLTNTYDSQYGRTGGGIVTIVSKSGGNSFHGNLYEYFQSEELNANQSELNSVGTKKPPMNINTFGFQASGPIVVPKVFDGRNKLFFLLSYEGMRQRSADPGAANFPLDQWRTGDFSGLLNAQGSAVTLYDPLTTDAAGNRTPFAGNIIPSNRINPVSASVMKFYPSPNSLGTGPAHINNYVYPSRWVADMNAWNGRLDYRINDRNTVYFRYGQAPFSEYRAMVWNGSNAAEPTGNAPLIRNGRNLVLDWTTILSPTMTFNLRGGLARWETSGGSTYGANFNPAQLGFSQSLVSQLTRYQYPRFSFSDAYQSIGSGDSVFNASPGDTYTLQPNLNRVQGSHTLKFGGEFRRYNDNSNNPGGSSGVYSFSRAWTQQRALTSDSISGNEFASFLLGYPLSGYVDRNIDPAYKNYYFAGFVQDDWRVNGRLTLNFGIRWDYEQPLVERYDRMLGEFAFSAANPISSSSLAISGVPNFAGVGGQPRGAFAQDRNNWQPRIGAAYRIADKWVARGGYGLYYLGQNERGEANGFSQRTNAIVTTDGNLTPAVNLTNAFANQAGGLLLSPVGTTQGASSFLGQSLTVNYFNRPLPYTQQFSFDIQHELPGNMLAEIGYAGNITKKLPINVSGYNAVPAAALGRRTSSGAIDTAWYNEKIANPMAGLVPNNTSLNAPTIPRQLLLYPFPQYSGMNINNLPIGGQNYNGLQTRLTKRFSHGLTFVASYAWTKTLEQLNLLNVQDLNLSDVYATPVENRSAQETDIPHKFSFAGVYELPFGHGKAFGSNMNKVADVFLGGWQLNWNLTLQSGWALDYPNAKQVQNGDAKPTDAQKAQGYLFNVDLWADPTTGKRVSQQESFTLRDFPTRFGSARVPGYKNIDASVMKNFHITEGIKLQFRGEMVNATNSPWFSRLASNGTNVTNANFGKLDITQRNLPRFVKLVLNLTW